MHASLWVFLGGGAGAVARWALSAGIARLAANGPFQRFPLGILVCNLLGCLAIGCLFGVFASRQAPAWLFPFVATGFLGGFTTFSAFGHDTHNLLVGGFTGPALGNLLLSTLGGLAMVYLGFRLVR